jgi:6-phosphofructokinase 1
VLKEAHQLTKGIIFGARHGLEGLIHGNVVNLGELAKSQLEQLRRTPGAALGSSRAKPSQSEMEGILCLLRKLDVRRLLFIGGNGTMRVAHMFSGFCNELGFDLSVIGIPKTIDNDINGTDRCPGYASAARYVAQSTRDLGMDVRSLPQPVSIFETMGRNVGWLAGASATGKRDEGDAPHLVYVPEVPFQVEKFLAELEDILTRQSWAIVVVSEGIRDIEGRPIYQTQEASQADALNRPLIGGVSRFLAEIVTRRLNVRCRDEKPGLIGRASILHASTQDLRDAEFIGSAALRASLAGHHDKMAALTPLESGGNSGCELVPLSSVTSSDRTIPKEWLCDGKIPVHRNFIEYVRPLIGDLLEYDSAVSDLKPYGSN